MTNPNTAVALAAVLSGKPEIQLPSLVNKGTFPQYQIPGGLSKGMMEPGNIDIGKRIGNMGDPQTQQAVNDRGFYDPNYSTVYSGNFTDADGRDVVIPLVIPDPRGGWKQGSLDEAKTYYRKTGQHLGKFTNPSDASNYAQMLHEYLASQASQPDGDTGNMISSLPLTQNAMNMLEGRMSPINTRNGLFSKMVQALSGK